MRKIVEAYEVLSDENKRESYKNWLVAKELNWQVGIGRMSLQKIGVRCISKTRKSSS